MRNDRRTGDEVIDELKRLAGLNDGLLKPEIVVEAAKSEDSILHKKFEWDDTEAGHKYRIWQARWLISVSVEYIHQADKVLPFRVFVSLSSDRADHENGGGYRELATVMANPERKQEMLQDALEAMDNFQAKYNRLSELTKVLKTMKQVSREIKGQEEGTKLKLKVS